METCIVIRVVLLHVTMLMSELIAIITPSQFIQVLVVLLILILPTQLLAFPHYIVDILLRMELLIHILVVAVL